MTTKNHYGILVDSEKPTTGVFSNGSIEWLGEEIFSDDAIDLDFEDHKLECKKRDHEFCYENDCSTTYLIGFKKNRKTKKFEADKKAEYSAIVGEIYTQVIKSDWGIKCNLCSPCYPGQGNADSPGEFVAYSLPPEILGETFPRINEVFRLN